MGRWRWSIGLTALMALGCDSGTSLRGDSPPEGAPWLAVEYAVAVEILATDCTLGGLRPVAAPAVASVYQDGLDVVWHQVAAEGYDGWALSGRLCPSLGLVRLRGAALIDRAGVGRLQQADGLCEVEATVPVSAPAPDDPCDDTAALTFALDACQVLSTEVDVEVWSAFECQRGAACTMRLRMTAVPTRYDTRTPEVARPSAECGT